MNVDPMTGIRRLAIMAGMVFLFGLTSLTDTKGTGTVNADLFESRFPFTVLTGMSNVYTQDAEVLSDTTGIDVFYYDLDVRIDPSREWIGGVVIWGARKTEDCAWMDVKLDAPFRVENIRIGSTLDARPDTVSWHRTKDPHGVTVQLPNWIEIGESFYLHIEYEGMPRVAETPPWDGGFVWAHSESGAPWIGVTAQMSGASIWWPSMNHPSDRPDSVSMKWTLPDSLIVASNGILEGVEFPEAGWKQWHWMVSHPVSPYQISLNAGSFRERHSIYNSREGRDVPIRLWVQSERESRAKWLEEELSRHLEFFEQRLGPYPFSDEKLGIVHTPYLGMEHQTILSYGGRFEPDGLFGANLGFDDLLHHELAHEWWGNMVTVRDWRHFWMHEGFATYMQALYAEEISGRSDYRRMMYRIRPLIRSRAPLVPPVSSTTSEMASDGRSADVYYKGAWILHTVREWIGPDRFDPLLKSFLWEGPGSSGAGTPPSRTVDSEMWIQWVEHHVEEPVRPVLESYLYGSQLPRLSVENVEDGIRIRWSDSAFSAIPVVIESERGRERLHIPESGLDIPGMESSGVVIDPDGSILMEDPVRM